MFPATALLTLSFTPLALGIPNVHQVLQHKRHIPTSLPGGLGILSFNVVIGVTPSNVSGLHATLMDVSTPASSNYRKYLSKEQVKQFVAPNPESLQAVTDWLAKSNVTYDFASPSQDILRINVSVATANQLLNANYTGFIHEETKTTFFRTSSYSVPPAIEQHLSFIYPTTHVIPVTFQKSLVKVVSVPDAFSSGLKTVDTTSSCDQEITPACLEKIYNIPSTPANASGNGLAVSGFGNEIANQGDLTEFLSVLRHDINNGIFTVQSIDGGIDNSNGQGTLEASLDIQYTMGLATDVPTTFVSVGSQNQDRVAGFLDIINFLLQLDSPPLVLTTSFGFDETAFDQSPDIAETLCNAYAQLGTHGVSILFASGDGGVAGSRPSNSCPNGFVPTFPSGCPYVTSVGSTQGQSPEVGASFSSGGFSNIFPQPPYQSTAVQGYLSTLGSTNVGQFNVSGRAYPDVSTQGTNFIIKVGGQGELVAGTSASSPTFASIVALINDQLLNAGQQPLGFLNPLLYSQGVAGFNDITSGSNPSCGTDDFPSVAGWDPVTGLGTPDFVKLLAIALSSGGQK